MKGHYRQVENNPVVTTKRVKSMESKILEKSSKPETVPFYLSTMKIVLLTMFTSYHICKTFINKV